jgi:hypothetical protein
VTPESLLKLAITPAMQLLPERMDTPAARAMMIAMALQESRIRHRKQIGGPAVGYWQFEQGGGVRGVLNHPLSKPHIQTVLRALDYAPESDSAACYAALPHNDILAAAFARLLLWTLPSALPGKGDAQGGWDTYISAWRPGKPHRATWDAFYLQAWNLV